MPSGIEPSGSTLPTVRVAGHSMEGEDVGRGSDGRGLISYRRNLQKRVHCKPAAPKLVHTKEVGKRLNPLVRLPLHDSSIFRRRGKKTIRQVWHPLAGHSVNKNMTSKATLSRLRLTIEGSSQRGKSESDDGSSTTPCETGETQANSHRTQTTNTLKHDPD